MKTQSIIPGKQGLSAPVKLWLPNLAPQRILIITGFLIVLCIANTVFVATHQPSLGIVWQPASINDGLQIKKLYKNHGSLRVGDHFISISKPSSHSLPLNNELIIEDPDLYPTYDLYNHFLEYQNEIIDVLTHSSVIFTRKDGKRFTLETHRYRAINQLPMAFWIYNLCGAICLLIGVGVWSYKRGEPVARLLALTSFGFFFSILCVSVYVTRELAINSVLFKFLSATNHLGMCLFTYSLLMMFCYYPLRMANRWVTCITYVVMAIVWLNQTQQIYQVPLHAYYVLTFMVPYAIAVPLAIAQWRKTSTRPVDRAVLKWFLLSIFISIGAAGSAFVIPAVSRELTPPPLWTATIFVTLMFICFAFGILRCGLFGLERWWFLGWVWLLSGLLIIGIDILIIQSINMSFKEALPLSILILGWVYFPLREWLWKHLVRPSEYTLENHLPKFITLLFRKPSMQSFIDDWEVLLKKIFIPLKIEIKEIYENKVLTTRNGLVLQIPGLQGKIVYQLIGNKRGTRLFGPRDIDLAESILNLTNAILVITMKTKHLQEKGASKERERIMRDLHDDVQPKLITIKHRSDSNITKELAESAFQSLRDTIYLLRATSDKPLEEVLSDWRAEIHERLEETPISLKWQQPESIEDIMLTSWQEINCGRILRESITNVLKHTDASNIYICFGIKSNNFTVVFSDNGNTNKSPGYKEGLGLGTKNMRQRTKDLEGEICWVENSKHTNEWSQGLTVELKFPLKRI